jgi:hypothetical protein
MEEKENMNKDLEQKDKKIWEEQTFKEWMHEQIAKGKTEKERREIEEGFCVALMNMNCSGLQGLKSK